MDFSIVLWIGGIMSALAIVINIIAFVAEKVYKKKMAQKANK